MAEPSSFRGALDLFNRIGLYDVVLPFLLVFTLVFAILEKTRVLGTEEIDGTTYPRRNLNSMMAFVIAFFVIASAELVEIITKVSSWVVLLLLASVLFLMMVGSFLKPSEEGIFLEGAWQTMFMIIMFVSLVLIYLHAVGWLELILDYVRSNWQSNLVATAIMLLIIFGALWFIVGGSPDSKKNKD